MRLAFPSDAAAGVGGGKSNARRALWTMLGLACDAAALAHAVFLLLFARLGLPLLVWTNIVSIALFICCRVLLGRRRNSLAVTLIGGEVFLHAVVASGLLGWDSGFHYYVLSLFGPLVAGMSGSTFSRIARLFGFGVGYAALDAWTRMAPPVYRLEPALLDALRYFNIAGMLAIMGFISLTYYRLVTAAERALRTLAGTDPLTGLHNRRRLLEIVRATRKTEPATSGLHLLMCDIDHFKQVNDVHGHEVGDLVLESVATAVMAAVRTTDSVARWGGEEFVVLLPGTDLASALQTGERIRRAVAALTVRGPAASLTSTTTPAAARQATIPVSITIGVSRVDPVDTIDAAIARADAALYRGKAAGRDRVVVDGEAAVPFCA